MQFFHGSRNDNVLELTTRQSRDGYVYSTSSRLVALTYMARSMPNLFSTFNGKEVFFELKPNLFEKMVKNKSGYIYLLESKDFEPVPQSNRCGHRDCYKVKEDVKVIGKEYIKDAYAELQKYVKSGEFKILTEDEISPERKERMIQQIKDIAKTLPETEINKPGNFWNIF